MIVCYSVADDDTSNHVLRPTTINVTLLRNLSIDVFTDMPLLDVTLTLPNIKVSLSLMVY